MTNKEAPMEPTPESDDEILCGCGCGQVAVDADSQVVADSHGFARETNDGSWWLAECLYEAEMALRCP